MISPNIFAHCTLHGRTDMVQGCGLPPERCIWTAEAGREPEKLVQGPYFWHSAGSMDGEWIVADTNWPDHGIQLVHVPTRHFRTLCHPHATLRGAVDCGHTHPCISQDGRLVVFRSDRTHIQQAYVAHVTDEFREKRDRRGARPAAGQVDIARTEGFSAPSRVVRVGLESPVYRCEADLCQLGPAQLGWLRPTLAAACTVAARMVAQRRVSGPRRDMSLS